MFLNSASSIPVSSGCMLARRLNMLQLHVRQNKVSPFFLSLGAESADL